MGIANQSLDPRKAGMGALGAGEWGRRDVWSAGGWAHAPLHLNLDALGTNEVDTGTSMLSSAPVLPEKRLPSDSERMQEHADLARLFGGVTIPLARLSQRAGTTIANTGGIHHAQAAISLSTMLLGHKRLPCWTAQRPVGLERKVGSGEATGFPRRVAAVGGPYPETGADTAGRAGCIAACERAFAMAGANSVMRRGEG